MLSIGKLTLGQQQYYLDQVAQGIEDYYTGAGETPGRWLASSRQLGLDGEVDAAQLRAVLEGTDPNGNYRLAAAHNRRLAGFDLTLSAPKSVSVIWGLSAKDVRSAIVNAHERSVEAALAYVERYATFTRRGHNGVEVIEARGLVAAGFRHRTSRNGDPQLHTHVLVPNMVEGVDGEWSTIDGRELFAHARTAGYLYQAELRHQLTVSLGVAWTPVQRGAAEITGIPKELLREFSTRRAEIEERLELSGTSTPSAARSAVLATRQPKTAIGSSTLDQQWNERAHRLGFSAERVRMMLGHAAPLELAADHAAAIEAQLVSPAGLTAKMSTFERRDVIRAMAELAPAGVTADAIEEWADAFLRRHDIVLLHSRNGVAYSTRELAELETRLVSDAVTRPGGGVAVVPVSRVRSVLRQYPTIEGEQAALVARLTTSGNGVDIVVAAAGTGKTFALGCAADIWKRTGHCVHGAALAGRAAQELESIGIHAQTIARLTKTLQQRPLTARDVVIIDEAAMVGTRALAPILDAAATGGAKVVLVGDYHLEAGGLLRGLACRLEPIELRENRRQLEGWERRALIELRNGNIEKAFVAYARHDRVHVTRDRVAARHQLVDAWQHATQAGDKAIMLAARTTDVEQLNLKA